MKLPAGSVPFGGACPQTKATQGDEMQKIRIPELVFVIGSLVFTVILGITALGYTPRGRLFPLVIVIPVTLLLLVKIFILIRPESAGRFEVHGIDLPDPTRSAEDQPESGRWPTELRMISWLAVLLVSFLLFGFSLTIPVFLLVFLKFQGRHTWAVSIACGATVAIFIYLMFVKILSVTFPGGFLFG
jgi:hypothetical protein